MTLKLVGIFCVIFLCLGISHCHTVDHGKKTLVPGRVYKTNSSFQQKLWIYCYKGVQKNLVHIWQTAYVVINLKPQEYDLYKGTSVEEILLMHEKSSWTTQLFSWKSDKIDLDPFNFNCIGIDTPLDHELLLTVLRIDFWRVACLVFGVFMFIAAPRLSTNPIFYYICGITLGITSSLLIALYLLSKLIPKRPTVYAVFFGGWAIGFYLFQMLWENLKVILPNYQTHVIIYAVVTGLISFVVCYRFGPVTDPRTKNLLKWAMQAASLILIFYSSRCQEASALIVLGLLLYYNFPRAWAASFFTFWTRTFPKKRKFLTEEEYHEEGVRETLKALNNLKSYCSSSECNQWKTALSLQNPKRYKSSRFAQFMEGGSHLEDSEILAYESESHKTQPLLTDDSDTGEED